MLPTSIRPGISRCPRGQCSHRGVGRRTPSGEATNSHGGLGRDHQHPAAPSASTAAKAAIFAEHAYLCARSFESIRAKLRSKDAAWGMTGGLRRLTRPGWNPPITCG